MADALDPLLATCEALDDAAQVRLAFDLRELVDATADLAAAMARMADLPADAGIDGLVDLLIDVDVQWAHVQLHWDGAIGVLRWKGLWDMDDLVLDVEPVE